MKLFARSNNTVMLYTASFLLLASAAALANSILNYRRMVYENIADSNRNENTNVQEEELWENDSEKLKNAETVKEATADYDGEDSIPETEETGY